MTRVSATTCLVFLMLAPNPSEACTCSWKGPFLSVAPGAETIIRGEVLRYYGKSRGVDLAMDVEVQEVLKGTARPKRIRIWGDNGAQCRPYVNGFRVGTEWVFAINRLKDGVGRGDFALSVCGEYWAKVEGHTVRGRLTSPPPPSVSDVPER